jgi:hypothetical protein
VIGCVNRRNRPWWWPDVEPEGLLPTHRPRGLDEAGVGPRRVVGYVCRSRSSVAAVPREVRRRGRVGRVESEWGKLRGQDAWDGGVDLHLGPRTTAVDALEVDIRVPRRRRGQWAALLALGTEADAVAGHAATEKNRILEVREGLLPAAKTTGAMEEERGKVVEDKERFEPRQSRARKIRRIS